MNRFFALLMALMLAFSAAAAEPIEDDVLLAAAIHLAQEVDLAAESEFYLATFPADGTVLALVESWRAGDHAEPSAVYRVSLNYDLFSNVMADSALSPALSANVMAKITTGAVSQLNSRSGVSALAASSAMNVSSALPGTSDCCIYILCYDEGADVAVSFYPFDGGLSGMQATFLAEKFDADAMTQLMQYFQATVNGTPSIDRIH